MRAVIQRVDRASVHVDGDCIADMGAGLLVLVGVGLRDDEKSAQELVRKILGLRIFEDDSGRMNRSLLETQGELCLVSQFTLWADTRKGRRPSFGEAADPEVARPLFDRVVEIARETELCVVTGRFGAMMEVSLVNSGPVTILIDTEKRF